MHEAQQHEKVFRWILDDLKTQSHKRPMGFFIPEDLDTTSNIETIYSKYCEWVRNGIFTLLNFEILDNTTAEITFQDVAPLSWGWAVLQYNIQDDQSIEYIKSTMIRKS